MDRSRSASSKTTTKHRTLVNESPGLTEVTRQQRPSDRGSRSRVTPSLVELCAGPVSEPPGTAGVDRSYAPPLVTIQSTPTRIVIPTTPATMRWFRRLRSRRRSVHSTVFSVFTFTCPVSARILAASRPAPPGAPDLPRSQSAARRMSASSGSPELADPVGSLEVGKHEAGGAARRGGRFHCVHSFEEYRQASPLPSNLGMRCGTSARRQRNLALILAMFLVACSKGRRTI